MEKVEMRHCMKLVLEILVMRILQQDKEPRKLLCKHG